ncbi:hypothetical protein I2F27_02030 [Acinetobacter sp. B5B]|uniref:hypothetical protein n=1 Tax=Acinetobacter baretiae TaxID=2605383 RepID=UPI0018C2AEE5|nr:hypothetical protein [Acinetobacter baretiae]MBF7684639.1 hypothetical protein [Acinetobacter baretiae]
MNIKTELNQQKQIKNAKRGGHKPSIAKDVNKHKIQKIQRLMKELEHEYAQHWHDATHGAHVYEQGYAQAIHHVQSRLIDILSIK